jgi:hypothetical protein
MINDFKNSKNINLRMTEKNSIQEKDVLNKDKKIIEKQSFFILLWKELKLPFQTLCKTIIFTSISVFIFSLFLYLFWNEV